MLDELGVADLLFEQGLKAPIYQYRDRSTDEVFSFDLSELSGVTRHSYRVQCEQWKLARHLAGLLAEQDNVRLLCSAIASFTSYRTAPTALRAIRREDPRAAHLAEHDLSALRTLFLAGEHADPDTLQWAQDALDRPVIDHWWQTETGSAIAANCLGLAPMPVKPGSVSVPVPGFNVRVVDDAGHDVPAGSAGSVVLGLPLPPWVPDRPVE